VETHQETDNAAKYDAVRGVEARLLTRFRAGLERELRRLDPASVLDAGCGEGHVTAWVADALPRARIRGIEPRPEARAAAIARRPGVEVRAGDLRALDEPRAGWDVVLCTEVLEHLDDPGAALAELARVARRALVLTVPHEPWFRLGNVARGRYLRRLGSTPGHRWTWSRRSFAALVDRHARVEGSRSLFPWQLVVARPDLP
jgi:2-polyprenyl-3-methyl-5-hydroxy-6-metoxy-1,4-benzoquinol methylase